MIQGFINLWIWWAVYTEKYRSRTKIYLIIITFIKLCSIIEYILHKIECEYSSLYWEILITNKNISNYINIFLTLCSIIEDIIHKIECELQERWSERPGRTTSRGLGTSTRGPTTSPGTLATECSMLVYNLMSYIVKLLSKFIFI